MGYGNYGYKLYTSKKGKNWYSDSSKYGTDNTGFCFSKDKAMILEDIESSNKIRCGLQPYAPIPKDSRYSDNTKLYFAIEEPDILLQSLNTMICIPFIAQDIIVPNNVTPTIVGYNYFNNPIYNNLATDVYNAIVYTDSITRGYLHNVIMAFCFEYVLPQHVAFDLSIYQSLINDIVTTKGFKDKVMLIRTDISNNRIMFIVSNITENSDYIDKYKVSYDNGTKYKGSDVLFTKRADTIYNTLDNKLSYTYQEYTKNIKIFIGKSKKL